MCVCECQHVLFSTGVGAGAGEGDQDQRIHVDDGSTAVDSVAVMVYQAVHLPDDLCHFDLHNTQGKKLYTSHIFFPLPPPPLCG